MYNPINMHIEDEDRLNEKDQREKNKKKRFEARVQIETQTKEEMFKKNKKDHEMALNKVSHMRVREEIERGFDIITNDAELKSGLAKMEATSFMKKAPGAWDKLATANESLASTHSVGLGNPQAAKPPVELTATRFNTRSKRLNTNAAKEPVPAASCQMADKLPPSSKQIRTSGF